MPVATAPTFAPAIAAICRHYERRSKTADALGRELEHILTILPEKADIPLKPPSGAPHPIARHIDAALAPAESRIEDILAPLRRVAAILPWRYSYTPRADAPGLEHRVAWAEFVGPVAPIASDEVCLGVTLIAPHTLYPLHRHNAVETYFVLSGTATWTAAGRSQTQPPGSFILHPSNIVHAMQTWDEPLLAVYTWSGDVHSTSVYADR
jgi:quercetin dioxygenase-like cupin family protein